LKSLPPYVCVLLAVVLLAAVESDLLYTLQEQNLFLHTTLFFEQRMVMAGGLLTWVGSYLTQYFYYPLLGAALLGLLWAFLMWLIRCTFKLSSIWLAGVPVLCLLLTVTDLGYWVYYLKLPGHAFCATVGTIVAVLGVWIYRLLPRRYGLRTAFIPLAAIIGYPLFGFYGLLAMALMGLMAWRKDELGQKRQMGWCVADFVLAVLGIAVVPIISYYILYHQTNIVNIYWTALPVFAMHGERYATYYLPNAILVTCLVAFALPLFTSKAVPLSTGKGRAWALKGVLACLTCIFVFLFWYRDDNFHRELAMSRLIEQQQWEEVLRTAHDVKGEPTRAICMMQNLALFRLNRLGDGVFVLPNGAKRPDAPFSTRLVHTVGRMLYLEYGLPNYCYRWCMEDGVEYGWTAERLKLMTLCSMLNGEITATQRFLNLLKKTDFHRPWALRYEALLYQPQRYANDPRLHPILPLLRSDNFLTADQSQLELFLIEHLLSSPGANRQQKDLANFTMRYYQKNRYSLVEP